MVAITEESVKREQAMEMTRREMQRKSLDIMRLYNPLDHNFIYKYDGYNHFVPAKTSKDEPRYLARHYFKKIAEYMIGLQQLKSGTELLKLREKQFGKSFLDKYEENQEVWNKVPRLDDPELLKQINSTVILGLVEEYGRELPEELPVESTRKLDLRSLTDQIFDETERKVGATPSKPVEEIKYPINKGKLAKEVSL